MRGYRNLRLLSLVCVLLAFSAGSGAQAALRVLRVADFGGDGIDRGEAAALQSLVTSYVVELKAFRVIDKAGQELAVKEEETAVQMGVAKAISPIAADYILSAEANRAGTLIVFSIDVTKVATGEKKSVAETFASVNDLILASRRLTRKLFEKPADNPGEASSAAAPTANPKPSLGLVAGTWKGDKNVDRISIFPDGSAFAVLVSGSRMWLLVTIEGSRVVIFQNQPNSPDFYRPGLDPKSAQIVAATARPWRWVFSLSTDGASLNGVKESVFVKIDDQGSLSLDNSYVRAAVWTRLFR